MKVFNLLFLFPALFLVSQQRPASTAGQLKDFNLKYIDRELARQR